MTVGRHYFRRYHRSLHSKYAHGGGWWGWLYLQMPAWFGFQRGQWYSFRVYHSELLARKLTLIHSPLNYHTSPQDFPPTNTGDEYTKSPPWSLAEKERRTKDVDRRRQRKYDHDNPGEDRRWNHLLVVVPTWCDSIQLEIDCRMWRAVSPSPCLTLLL